MDATNRASAPVEHLPTPDFVALGTIMRYFPCDFTNRDRCSVFILKNDVALGCNR
jgi:hypothetical protein